MGLLHTIVCVQLLLLGFTHGQEAYTSVYSESSTNPTTLPEDTTIDDAVPSKPLNLTVLKVTKDTISLQWSEPDEENGLILGYRIYFKRGNYTDVRFFKLSSVNQTTQYVLVDLVPNTEYRVVVKAFTWKNEGDPSDEIVATTDIAAPTAPKILNLTCEANDSLFIRWQRPQQFTDPILFFIIHYRSEHLYDFDEIQEPDCTHSECYTHISNLTVNTMYEVYVRGVSKSKVNPDTLLLGVKSDSRKMRVRENCDKVLPFMHSGEVFIAIHYLSIIACCVFALFLGVVGFVLWRKCLRDKKYSHCAAYYYLSETVCEAVSDAEWENTPRCNANCANDLAVAELGQKRGAIPVAEFAEHVTSLHVDGDIGFSKEYEAIQAESNKLCIEAVVSTHPENKPKNRYLNIIAYDHTRVTLLPAQGQKRNILDYVNANYIDGFFFTRAFIGTQGPLPSTFDCFWRMVWEQRVVIIVMITNLVERGRRKCDMYWPKEGVETYGFIEVKLIKEDIMATYTIRTLQLRHLKIKRRKAGVSEKIVYQYHYTNWPDHGTPDHPLPVIHFVKKSSNSNVEGCPIIVHCSAGVGRTGTYIVLDTMLREISSKGETNIWGFLKHIRTQRNFLVQTEEQYIFIHDALVEAIATGVETNIQRAHLPDYIQILRIPDDNGEPWKELREQFKLITSFQCQDFNLVSANKTINQPKNRNQNIVPMENSRVHLTPKPGEDGSDYINATWLQGFHSLREFIITQHPLPDTVLHFWQMVWDHNVQTIVMLSYVDHEEYPLFWPTEHNEIESDSFKMKLTHERILPTHLIREMTMQSLQDDYELHVRLVQCSGWPHTCPTIATVFDLPNAVQTSLLEYQNGPVVVMDRFGGTEAASYCCLTSLAKHLAFDGYADTYMMSKLYHNKRPGIWNTYEDYLRLHLALQAMSPSTSAVPDLYASANGCVTTSNSNGNFNMEVTCSEPPAPVHVPRPEVVIDIPVDAA